MMSACQILRLFSTTERGRKSGRQKIPCGSFPPSCCFRRPLSLPGCWWAFRPSSRLLIYKHQKRKRGKKNSSWINIVVKTFEPPKMRQSCDGILTTISIPEETFELLLLMPHDVDLSKTSFFFLFYIQRHSVNWFVPDRRTVDISGRRPLAARVRLYTGGGGIIFAPPLSWPHLCRALQPRE